MGETMDKYEGPKPRSEICKRRRRRLTRITKAEHARMRDALDEIVVLCQRSMAPGHISIRFAEILEKAEKALGRKV